MMTKQWITDGREQMKTHPVRTKRTSFLTHHIMTVFVIGVLLCVQVWPVNAASDTQGEANMTHKIVQDNVPGDVESVWNKLLLTLKNMNIPVFSTVDHRANAVSVGLDMKQARVVFFGNPAVGTLLMQKNPEVALDLPLKILVWESPDGTVLSWNDPAWMAQRYKIDRDDETVKKMQKMFGAISEKMHDPH